jgi:hypothetical protein
MPSGLSPQASADGAAAIGPESQAACRRDFHAFFERLIDRASVRGYLCKKISWRVAPAAAPSGRDQKLASIAARNRPSIHPPAETRASSRARTRARASRGPRRKLVRCKAEPRGQFQFTTCRPVRACEDEPQAFPRELRCALCW